MNKVHSFRSAILIFWIIVFAPVLNAQSILKSDYPNEYVVKKGDTLWDISAVFLKSPWLWPQIWENNSQIVNPHLIYPNDVIYLRYRNGQPYLSTSKLGEEKLGPKIRVAGRFSAVSAIPKIALQSFVSGHRIVGAQAASKMPYILAGAGLRELIASGDEVYIRGVLDPDYNSYHIYRLGKTYGAEHGLSTENTEIIKVGSLDIISKQGEIARALVTKSKGLIVKGDIIVRSNELSLKPLYHLAAAPGGLEGKVIAAVNDAYQIAKYDGVVINLGANSSIYPGHVFNIIKAPIQVKDPRTQELITIASQPSAVLMVVNVFENLSYGIVLSASDAVSPGDSLARIE
ncbi:MAG: LysM peptidoglycan-binding domain-containing protein [Pseudomonadales bacterium]|nr:LysM peptidoglycan-binding domain-containing protein [Pseudomonadales bacterium]NRA15759.1 LysM peptidoglycan-binding domain-containing protein [Oceanospirillaceae bacterium]